MELDCGNPSEINSFHINGIQRADVIDLNKKRKIQAEQLGLPISKYICSNGSLPSKSLLAFIKNPEAEGSQTNIIKAKADKGTISDISKHESANDSNSFAENSDSAMSEHVESEFEEENGKMFLESGPSPSSFNWGSSSSRTDSYSLDSKAVMKEDDKKEQLSSVSEKYRPYHNVDCRSENLDETPLEYRSQVDNLCLCYSDEMAEEFTEKEIEDILSSSEANPNLFVLSSGRWSVNQASQQGKRKPTIDQEFEQYFSTLLL